MAEKADRSNNIIMPFVTSNDSRRDNETGWLLDVRRGKRDGGFGYLVSKRQRALRYLRRVG